MTTFTIGAALDTFQRAANSGTPAAAPAPEPGEVGEGMTEEQWDALLELAWDKYETVGLQGERFMWAGDFGSALDFVRQEIARHGQKLAPPVDQPVATPGPGEPETEQILAHPGFAGCHDGTITPPAPEPGEAGELAGRLTLISEGMSAMDQEEDSWFVARGAIVIAHQAAELAALRGVPVAVSERLPDPNTKVLAHYCNKSGKWRTICAIWVPAKTRVSDSDTEDDLDIEYDEETDQFYWPEGWYETIENWEEFGYLKVYEGEVAYWEPLPKRPHDAIPLPAPQAGEVQP